MRFYTNVQMIGNQFLVRGYDNGEHVMFKEEYSPTLFVKSNKETKYKTLEGEYVEAIQPGSVRDCRDFIKKYEGVENFKIYGNDRYVYQYISDKYPEDEIKFDITKIKLVTLDIETTSENGFPDTKTCEEEILLITIQDYSTKDIITWGTGAFNNTQSNVKYIQCESEYALLNSFINYWENNTPEVITGWNIQFFDIPYICGRLLRVLGEKRAKRFSPWGLVSSEEVFVNNRQQVCVDIGGITQLDYLDLYKKFTYKARESYRLDYIAEVELGQKKLDHSEFDTFRDFYTKGWQKFVEYNIIDVELVDRLEDKMKLIELAITMAYDAKVNFVDVFFQVRMWDTIIYNYLKKKNIVIPPKDKSQKDEKYAGAYVKEPIPGVYDWIINFDLNSLYPHLIMQFNVSPETLLDERCPNVSVDKILNKEVSFEMYKDYAVCPNGAMYRKDVRGILPELMEKMYNERVIFKQKMIDEKKNLEEIESEMRRRRII
jgi:DNA polymerase elongation subunit (family B)